MLDQREVVAFKTDECSYAADPPFHPSTFYPEYEGQALSSSSNPSYDAVRGCFAQAGLDRSNFGTAKWNPLRDLIRPGETVLLKPNLVKEAHPRDPEGWRYVLTHGSVIRAVADYVWKALDGRGRIILADAPQTDSSFTEICRVLGLNHIRDFYASRSFPFDLADLRQEEWTARDGVIVDRRKLSGDPNGAVSFDLGAHSEFKDHSGGGHYYGADYDEGTVNYHHTGGRHEYLIAGSAIHCDVLFSLPKLKTHKKSGITVSLKNLVGINADKNWLPHHTEGSPAGGGDEHPNPGIKHRVERQVASQLRKVVVNFPALGARVLKKARSTGLRLFGDTETVIRSGNWYGNDTIWRMCLDLNKLVLYGNPDGSIRDGVPANRKRHFVLVDGILAGEGRGPMNPDPVNAGLLVFGTHPPSVDATCAYLMGFDPLKIPIVRESFRCKFLPLSEHQIADITVNSNVEQWNHGLLDIPDASTFHFVPHFGWKGHIERQVQTELVHG